MDDRPYTTPEEDPFNVRPLPNHEPRRRRSSMLDKWIQEQFSRHTSPKPPLTSETTRHTCPPPTIQSYAYLAYPDLNRTSLDGAEARNDTALESGYDLVEDDDIPRSLAAALSNMKLPDSPTTVRTKKGSRVSLTPSSFRQLHRVFRSAPASGEWSPSRVSTGTIKGTPEKTINRSSLISHSSHTSPSPRNATPTPSKRRPGIFGHFGPSPDSHSLPSPKRLSSDSNYTPSRPSVSSSIGTSNAQTMLTIPSAESSTTSPSLTPSSPPSHQKQQSPPADSIRSNTTPRYLTPTLHQHHNLGGNRHLGASSTSLWSQVYPSSVNTNIDPVDALNSSRDFSSSPTLTSNTGSAPGMRTLPRIYPYVYNNSVQVSARRGANAFNGYFNTYNPGVDHSTGDDGDDDSDLDEIGELPMQGTAAKNDPQQNHQEKKKPHVVYSSASGGGALSRMASLSTLALAPMVPSARKKKKKLVVSGIAPDDVRKFEGVKRWCESFGEIRQITRMPNGDLIVAFRSAEVADTVCRVRAKVHINGVGSVQLSWVTGNKR